MREKISEDLKILIPNFIKNRMEDAENLLLLLKNKDYQEASKISHSLKGVLGSYGFKNGYLMTSEIDKKIKNSDFERLLEEAQDFQKYMSNVEIEYVDEEL
ncbi:Hpt domain-containing protein [uncultured Ilyobacter sp.]|uniref:Hpt domain-containing protein n=1 Tax=uncultured Ilyobacter sp. TaxID=544433 RepID=UPI002AA8271A|nr:Hpt domain-containing protein [uncultured Ilyobacter sp.]